MQLASIPVTLPLARTLMAQTAPGAGAQKRLAIFMCNNGTKRGNFWPAPVAGMSSYPITTTPVLNALFTSDGMTTGTTPGAGKVDNGLKAKTNLFRGLQVISKGSSGGNQHDNGFAQQFTGVPLISGAGGAPFGGGISFDQVLAKEWGQGSFTTAVLTSQVQAGPKPGFNHRRSFAYVGPGLNKMPYVDPLHDAYNNVFAGMAAMTGSGASAAATAQMLAERKSVLDAVSGDLTDLQGRLGPDDARKLDLHVSAIRDAESQLTRLSSTHGSCMVTAPKDYTAMPGGAANLVSLETYIPDMIDAMSTMMTAALTCGITRVASLQFGYGGGKWACGWLKINTNHHDSIAHHDTSDTGTDQISAWVTLINQYYASVVQKFAMSLMNTPDPSGHGTMLDNTLVIWTNELGRGDHQLTDIPVVFIGLVGNGIKAGGRVLDYNALKGGQQTHNIFGYHALNALGHTTPGWGDTPDLSAFAFPGF